MTTKITYTGTQELTIADALVLTVDFEVVADVTYEPAVLGGPPESCSPDCSELDFSEERILSIKDECGNEVAFQPETQGRLLAALDWDKIEAGVWEQFHDERQDSSPDDDGYDLSD